MYSKIKLKYVKQPVGFGITQVFTFLLHIYTQICLYDFICQWCSKISWHQLLFWTLVKYFNCTKSWTKAHSETGEACKIFAKSFFDKKFRPRCLIGFWILLFWHYIFRVKHLWYEKPYSIWFVTLELRTKWLMNRLLFLSAYFQRCIFPRWVFPMNLLIVNIYADVYISIQRIKQYLRWCLYKHLTH